MNERTGVYICRCGTNISAAVDVEALAELASALDCVAAVRTVDFLCSGEGQATIARGIKEEELSRVVVAACSPHMHEATFRLACSRAGLNPYLLDIANIREQIAWVTPDRDAATRKARAALSGAVNRVRRQAPLQKMKVGISRNALVVGGGIAGITAALEIADAGRHVYLVERQPSIGGRMAQLDRMFPTLDCQACVLAPKMAAVRRHPNITLLTFSSVQSVKGFAGNFDVKIRKRARSIDEERCIECGLCQQKCPEVVADEVFEAGLGTRKACYTPFAEAVPKYPVIDRDNCSFYREAKCRICEKECPVQAIRFDQEDEMIDIKAGAVILATGFDLFDPRRVPQYGYGRYANVFTSLEFERMLSAGGPTGGRIVLRDGVTEPGSVAVIHCVGSRDRNYREYCSKICCMYSLKFAHLVMERTGASVYNFYIDMRTPGKGYEEFYHRVLDEGAHFIRGRVASVTDAAYAAEEEGKLVVQAEDTLLGVQRRVPVDMVILSPAVEARADAREVARMYGLVCDAGGFFSELHPKLDPVATMNGGIFIAGACQGPKDISESVAQAGAAAAKAIALLGREALELEPIGAQVITALCSGCRICASLCPFGAIGFDNAVKAAVIDRTLCQGCGTCVAACPANAIEGFHYTDAQIMAELEGLLRNGEDLPGNNIKS